MIVSDSQRKRIFVYRLFKASDFRHRQNDIHAELIQKAKVSFYTDNLRYDEELDRIYTTGFVKMSEVIYWEYYGSMDEANNFKLKDEV